MTEMESKDGNTSEVEQINDVEVPLTVTGLKKLVAQKLGFFLSSEL